MLLLFGGIQPVTSTATWEQPAAGWAATASENIAATATWTQPAAAWDAVASSAEDITLAATFDQAAAAWDATATESITATASWVQAPAIWDAAASSAEDVTAEATWVQEPASWDATASSAKDVTATAEWVQAAASWAATASVPGAEVSAPHVGGVKAPRRPRFGRLEFEIERGRKRVTHPSQKSLQPLPLRPLPPVEIQPPPEPVEATASFIQSPAAFAATVAQEFTAIASWTQEPASFAAEAVHMRWWEDPRFLMLDDELAAMAGRMR